MGKRFNRWLRMAASRGINVGTAAQAAQTFTSGRAAAGKKIGTPAKAVLKAQASGIKDANTLQNIAKADNPLKAAKKGANKAAAVKGAIASGVDPAVAGSLGSVKKVKNVQKKATAATAVAQAGGDAASQALAAQGGKNNKPVQAAKKIISSREEAAPAPAAKKMPMRTPDPVRYDTRDRKLGDDENLKIKKKGKRRRRAIAKGTGQLRIGSSGQQTNIKSRGAGGINV
jgi:hypothetical protein